MLAWIAFSALAGLAALAVYGPLREIGVFLALMLAPPLITLWMAQSWGKITAHAAISALWVGAGCAGIGISGGLVSPALATLAVGPALALKVLGRRAGSEVFGFAVLGLIIAVLAPLPKGGAVTQMLAGVAGAMGLVGAVGLMLSGRDAVVPRARQSLRYAKIGHELRTPLNHIIGFADLMRAEPFGPLPERYRGYAGHIIDAGRHLLDLVNAMVDLGRLEAQGNITREKAAVLDIAVSVIEGAKVRANERALSIDTDFAAAPANAMVDAQAWRQILYNLIGNGVKYTPEGGRVIVRVFALQADLVLEVEDNGPGVSDAVKARLGEDYVRGDGVEGIEGSGLGLSLVRALARAHGGDVSFYDAVPHGLVARVVLAQALRA
jgi:signal transduction histidine kinase